jgi:N-sulfoglucosamine sulfohydrolase
VDFAPSMLSLLDLPIPDHLQGQPFLGRQKAPPRTYIYAAKDRMDPALDNARAVRDVRFKYILNLHPERPFVQFLPYRDQMPLMQELHRLHREDKLEGVQRLWFHDTKPVEELYDTWTDPHEVNNLADDPAYRDKLLELREAHERWRDETRDWGLIPEPELIKQPWPPDGIQPTTAGVTIAGADSVFTGQTTVTLRSATEGASIAYSLDGGQRWLLYSEPLVLSETATVQAQAIRIGFKPSDISTVSFRRADVRG